MECYNARITPWNITVLKTHHEILQYQNNNIIKAYQCTTLTHILTLT
jgi:hypothetical protein